MRVTFSPKEQFQSTHKETAAKELAQAVQSDNFHLSLSAALAHLVTIRNVSADQVSAVREFIHILLHLPFPDEPAPQIPIKQLDQSVYESQAKRFGGMMAPQHSK